MRAFAARVGSAIRRAVAHPLAVLVFIGLLIRIALAPYTTTWDVRSFYSASVDMLGGRSPYDSMFYTYPPAWAHTIVGFALLLNAFVPVAGWDAYFPALIPIGRLTGLISPSVTTPVFNLVFKVPIIAADLVMGLLLYRILRDARDAQVAKRGFGIWFLNPLVILSGAVQGQFDVLPSLFVMVAVYFLLKGEPLLAGAALAISAAYKLFAVYLFLPYLVLLALRPRDRRAARILDSSVVRLMLGFVGVSALAWFSFPLDSGFRALFRRFDTPGYGGFTPLAIFSFLDVTTISAYIVTAAAVATGIVVVSLAWWYSRRSGASEHSMSLLALASLNVVLFVVVYALAPLVNSQYLLWAFPSIILLFSLERGSQWLYWAITLTGVASHFAIMGPLAYFYPAALWLGTPSLSLINGSIASYWSYAGIFGGFLWFDIVRFISWIGLAFVILQARVAFRVLRRLAHG